LFEDRSPVGFSSCGIMIELFMSELFKLNNLGNVFLHLNDSVSCERFSRQP
jgi:hypothetical protein